MHCHVLIFLVLLGFAAALVLIVMALTFACEWVSRKGPDWAPWAILGFFVVMCLAVFAWAVPCKGVL